MPSLAAKLRRRWAELLGAVQFVRVADEITVANLIGRHGVRHKAGAAAPPIRTQALRAGLERVARYARENAASLHMPRIGCGLAGGRWELIEPIIEETLVAAGLPVTVYDFGSASSRRRQAARGTGVRGP